MYRTCIFCKKALGANEVLEEFPVGRRLAFDSAKGRLCAVCPKCRRWNLTPIEERWEAIEECERLFRSTRTRVSTENIGIARHPEGLELVRIGEPPRPEFAAWRYGDQLGERKRKSAINAAAMLGCVGVGALFSLAIVAAVPGVVLSPLLFGASAWIYLRPTARVRIGGETGDAGPIMPRSVVKFRILDLQTVQLLPQSSEPGFFVRILKGGRQARFEGDDARRVAAAILPFCNGWGGSTRTIQRAVGEIESSGHPGRFLFDVASRKTRPKGSFGYVRSMPRPTRLAVEMALHEEGERRALEGELRVLEQAWKEAEEIAAISDSLLLPARTEEFFKRHGWEGDPS